MDPFNPIIAEAYMKPVPLWQVALVGVICVAIVLASVWWLVKAVFSLERI